MGNMIDTGIVVVAMLAISGALAQVVSARLVAIEAMRAENRRIVEAIDALAVAQSRAMALAEQRQFEAARDVLDEALVEARVTMGAEIGVGGK